MPPIPHPLRRRTSLVVSLALALLLVWVPSCRRAEPTAARETADAAAAVAPQTTAAAAGDATPLASDPTTDLATAPKVVFLGDSLTAGLGLAEDRAYPALVGKALAAQGHPIRVVNAGVSGDTSAGGLRRLDWLLSQKPDLLVVCLGANDGLRGLPLEETEKNLREIVTRARAAGAKVLLVGMLIPPNYGADYAQGFAAIYPRLAKEFARDADFAYVPFLLEGVGGVEELNQADGIHPNEEGQEKVAQNLVAPLARLLAEK